MRIADALTERQTLRARIAEIRSLLKNVATVQEGDKPSEEPSDLMAELDSCLKRLEILIYRINMTNAAIKIGDRNLTSLMAERDVLRLRIGSLREILDSLNSNRLMYTRSEIKMIKTMDPKIIRAEINTLSEKLRKLDLVLEEANFTHDLIE
jgi:hypothetical protein